MFGSPLITCAYDAAPDDAIALAVMLAPDAHVLRVILRVPVERTFVFGHTHLRRLEEHLEAGEQALATLRKALAERGFALEGDVIADVNPDALASAVARYAPDVVVFGRFPSVTLDEVAGIALETARIFRVVTATGRAHKGAPRRIVCPFDGRAESIAGIASFLRDRCDDRFTITLFAIGPRDARLGDDMSAMREVAGMRAHVELTTWSDTVLEGTRDAPALLASDPDLIIVPSDSAGGFAADAVRGILLWALPNDARPVLFVPSSAATPPIHDGELDALDVLSFCRAAARLERIAAFGGPRPLSDQSIDVVQGGRRVATLSSSGGLLAISPTLEGTLGIGRTAEDRDPLEVVETVIMIMRCPAGRVTLVDAHLDVATLARVRSSFDHPGRTLIAVRLSPGEPSRLIRARFRAAGHERACVVDVRDILDEGDTEDVPNEVFAVRLCRAAARLRAHGAAIDSVVAYAPAHARGDGFAVLGAATLADAEARMLASYRPPVELGTATDLDTLTASRVIAGNRFAIDLDNAAARARMVALIDSAHERVHAQWYIVEDDAVSREIARALERASARGVVVRILVDSLYSLHGSFGARNALLERLAGTPGIEVRATRPIVALPGIEDLKRRDHRKLATADGARGIVSGRNLARTYYEAFEEARISRTSSWAEVPWLDASAWLEGPAVAELDASFLEAWRGAGGESFGLVPASPCGDTSVRVVVHRGLEDAYTLEAYLAIIEAARERLVVVNSFPLQREVAHALLRATTRGVHLSVLVGHVRPTYGEDIPFAGGAYRALIDALVRARLAALVDAGADVRELVVTGIPGWDGALGVVRPYVHAKLLCADRRCVAIGSANLDVTAGYWESEALVVVTDESVGEDLGARLDGLLASAVPIDPHDPKWESGRELRAWLGRAWPSVLG